MRQMVITAILFVAAMGAVPYAAAQTPDDVAKLKAENENLRKQMSNLEKEIELQKREIALLRQEAKTTPEATEDEQAREKSSTKDNLGTVEFELIRCARDPKTRTRVAFTFGMKCEKTIDYFLVPYQLALFDGDGAALDIKVIKEPDLGSDIVGHPRYAVKLLKGELIKFQIIIDGVKESLSLIDRVELTHPPRGFVIDKLVFKRIKIASEK